MEIKILVPENRESDLDNFIKDCENKGFELQNRGDGHMPNFSGYYATLKGSHWEPIQSEIPNPTAQLKAEKEEMRELLERMKNSFDTKAWITESQLNNYSKEIESLIQKIKQ